MFLKFFRKKPHQEAEAAKAAGAVDEEMFYCPQCDIEYRLHLDACPHCRVPLISGAEKTARQRAKGVRQASRSREIEADEELVAIRRGSLADMKRLRQVLLAGHIPAQIVAEEGGCASGCRGPEMVLQLRPEDVDDALRLLAEDFVRSTALDAATLSTAQAVFNPQAAEVQCPACGHRFPPSFGACPDCGLSFE